MVQTLPLFHLYGDPPDAQAFDFIHAETIAAELRKVEVEPCALPAGNVPASNVRDFLK